MRHVTGNQPITFPDSWFTRSSLPSPGQLVEHLLVQLGITLLPHGQEDVPSDILVNDLDVGRVAGEGEGVRVHFKRQLLHLRNGGELETGWRWVMGEKERQLRRKS